MSKNFYQALGNSTRWPNVENPQGLTYDDVLIVPGMNTTVQSRTSVDISQKLGPYTLSVPIITAPMDTVSGPEMIRTMAELGAIGTINRGDIKKNAKLSQELTNDAVPFVSVVKLHTAFDDVKILVDHGTQVVLIDTAHGGMKEMLDVAYKIKSTFDICLIAGNIVTYEHALAYKDVGIDILRVGVGPGGACITRQVTGVGFPQLSAVFETSESGVPVIADGGIKKSGDFAKAFAAGASFAMIGSMFAGTDEAPVKADKDGLVTFRGQASESYMNDSGLKVDAYRVAEGVTTKLKRRGSVVPIFHNLTGGLRSSMSYVGAQTLEEFYKKSTFVKISAETQKENGAHVTVGAS